MQVRKQQLEFGVKQPDWFQIGLGVRQGRILSPYLFNLYSEYIMRNAKLDEAQDRIKITRRNINNIRYVDDTTFMAENEEELKNFLMTVKEESEKAGLKLNIQKTKVTASGSIISWHIDGETMETVSRAFTLHHLGARRCLTRFSPCLSAPTLNPQLPKCRRSPAGGVVTLTPRPLPWPTVDWAGA